MDNLKKFINEALPAVSGSSLTYNADSNMFLSTGYTSAMGHTYFQGIQLSGRVAVVYSVGRGAYGNNPLFLNSVSVYCFDGKAKKLIGVWDPFDWHFYSQSLAQSVATDLLFNYLKSQLSLQGASISDSDLLSFAKAQIKEATTANHCDLNS